MCVEIIIRCKHCGKDTRRWIRHCNDAECTSVYTEDYNCDDCGECTTPEKPYEEEKK